MRPSTRSIRSPKSDGFSLLELMIALVIMGVITSQLFVMLNANQRGFRGTSRTLDLQESTRLIADLIAFDTRNAGMLVPQLAAVASDDGGNNGADRLCVSDGTIFPIPNAGVQDTFWDNLDSRFSGAIALSAAGDTIDLNHPDFPNNLDIDGQGNAVDFTVGAGIIIADADGSGSHCAAITRIDPVSRTIEFDRDLPAGVGGAGSIAVPAIIYDLDPDPNTPNTLRRNGTPLSNNVEDLQVEFWVDNEPTGPAPFPNGLEDPNEFPIHDLSTNPGFTIDTARVRRVQISVVGIADQPDDAGGAVVSRFDRPRAGNRTDAPAATTLDRKRQLFVTSVLPRNILNPGVVPGVP